MPNIQPMIIAIWYGGSKPGNLTEYFQLFVTEMKDILKNGIVINNYRINVRIRCFICDTLARSFVKGIICA